MPGHPCLVIAVVRLLVVPLFSSPAAGHGRHVIHHHHHSYTRSANAIHQLPLQQHKKECPRDFVSYPKTYSSAAATKNTVLSDPRQLHHWRGCTAAAAAVFVFFAVGVPQEERPRRMVVGREIHPCHYCRPSCPRRFWHPRLLLPKLSIPQILLLQEPPEEVFTIHQQISDFLVAHFHLPKRTKQKKTKRPIKW